MWYVLVLLSPRPPLACFGLASRRIILTRTSQGTGDNFYKQGQLLPENLEKVAKDIGLTEKNFELHYQEDYDHSYYFMSTFADSHVEHAAKALDVGK